MPEPTKGKPAAKPKPPEHVEVFYSTQDGSYLYRLGGEFVTLKLGDVRRHMRALGLREDVWFDGQRECDWPMYYAQVARRVYYAGSLGGHHVGTFVDGSGRRFLVTDEARGVFDPLPKKIVEPKLFKQFIEELLPGDQWQHQCFWLAIGLRSLRSGDFRPGQVSIFAGEVGCGKSLLQYLITEIFGGRTGNPLRYMREETTFNDDFANAEHWLVEELRGSTDIRSRLALGDILKEFYFTRDFSVHPKNKKATPLPLFRRGTISMNHDAEILQVLPPFNGSIEDKVNLYHCSKVVKTFEPFRGDDGVDRAKLWQAFMAEIPMIRAWLLTQFKRVPAGMREDRCGIESFHHADLLAHLSSYAPEVRLLELIDLILFDGDNASGGPWDGRSIHLEEALRGGKLGFEVDKVLKGSNKIGTYMARLMKSNPERVSKRTVNGHAHWTIKAPGNKQTTENL